MVLRKFNLSWWEGAIWNERGEVFVQGPGPLDMSQWGNDEEPDDHISDFAGFLEWQDRPGQLLRTSGGRTVEVQVFDGKVLDDAALDVLAWLCRGEHERLKARREQGGPRSSKYVPEEKQFWAFAQFLAKSKQVFVA